MRSTGTGRQRGYTVLEIMVTIFILALVCMTTATLIANARRLNASSSFYVRAYQIGEAVTEELASIPLSGSSLNLTSIAAAPGTWTPSVSIPEPFFIPSGGIGVTILTEGSSRLAPRMVRVNVTVAWKDTRGGQTVEKSIRLERLVPGNTLR